MMTEYLIPHHFFKKINRIKPLTNFEKIIGKKKFRQAECRTFFFNQTKENKNCRFNFSLTTQNITKSAILKTKILVFRG